MIGNENFSVVEERQESRSGKKKRGSNNPLYRSAIKEEVQSSMAEDVFLSKKKVSPSPKKSGDHVVTDTQYELDSAILATSFGDVNLIKDLIEKQRMKRMQIQAGESDEFWERLESYTSKENIEDQKKNPDQIHMALMKQFQRKGMIEDRDI